MKNTFRIVPLDTEVAEQARRTVAAGQHDHQLIVADSANGYPCRHCLEPAAIGEVMILFPYQSIPAGRPYAESGPIFVHQKPCARYAAADVYPAALRQRRLIRGYNEECEIVSGQPTDDSETAIQRMLAEPAIAFLHVRSLTHGCYTMKVERA